MMSKLPYPNRGFTHEEWVGKVDKVEVGHYDRRRTCAWEHAQCNRVQ